MVLEDAVLSRSKVTKPTYMPTLARRKVTYLMSKQSLKIFGHQPIPSVETRIDFNSYTNPTVERWLWRWRWGIAARLGLSPQKDQETWELSLSYLSLERVIIIKKDKWVPLTVTGGSGTRVLAQVPINKILFFGPTCNSKLSLVHVVLIYVCYTGWLSKRRVSSAFPPRFYFGALLKWTNKYGGVGFNCYLSFLLLFQFVHERKVVFLSIFLLFPKLWINFSHTPTIKMSKKKIIIFHL